MSEKNLQFDIVMHFHNTYRDQRGMLFEVNNSTDKGASRKGQGLVKGVSDLVYCAPNGRMIGLELKEDSSRHNVKHLREQLNWAVKLHNQGGASFFVFTLEEFKSLMIRFSGSIDNYYIGWICRRNLEHMETIISKAEIKGLKTVKLVADGK